MRTVPAVDAAELSRFADKTHPLWWGIGGLVAVELTVAGALMASYFYLMFNAPEWPPAGLRPPELLWASVNLVLLLTSSLTMRWAGRGLDRGSQRICTIGTGVSVLIACIVLVLRWLQMAAFEFCWDSHPYGSIVWAITGFHFVHVCSAAVGTAVVTLLSWRGHFTPERQLGVGVDTLYWYFVAGIWVPFYLTLYRAPRLQ
ncbi:heme-copper oxidase subunit III [Falsiroseomonas sp.]|uniref:cytochrome c oxidase subunit 3 n=1 Tax=Falsiroseomonas sp. TaxID=2870721 RepID=UPI0035684C09